MQIRFTKSTRRHRVGRERALYVIEHPFVVVIEQRPGRDELLMHLGDDHTGRALEVGVLQLPEHLLVIHVMDLRPKYRPEYEAWRPR